jgi:hypothetical protein
MDIGPISAIRPVSMARPSPPGSDTGADLAGVFAVEFRNQQPDDAYSPSRQPDRGLEDDDETDESESASALPPDGSVSYFT